MSMNSSSTETLEIDCKHASHREITADGEAIKISIKCDTNESNGGEVVLNKKYVSIEEKNSQRISVCNENHKNDIVHNDEVFTRKQVKSPESKEVKVCQFYKKSGNCRFGNKCYYFHHKPVRGSEQKNGKGSSNSSNDRKSNDTDIDTSSTTEKQMSRTNREFLNGGENSYLNINSSNARPCVFFSTKRGCKLGDECPFTHYRSVGDAGADVLLELYDNVRKNSNVGEHQTKEGVKVDEDPKIRTKKISSAKRCIFFQKDGFCRKGDKCHFAHTPKGDVKQQVETSSSKNPAPRNSIDIGEPDNLSDLKEHNTDSSSSKKTKKCYYFKRNGCWLKDECPYVHDRSETIPKPFKGNGNPYKVNNMIERKGNQGKEIVEKQQGDQVNTESNKEKKPHNKLDEREGFNINEPFKKSNQYCTYYLSPKGCFHDKNCGYLHPLGEKETGNSEDYLSLQTTEYKQLEIRFSAGDKFKIIQSEPSTIYSVIFEPSDPDWGIVVKEFVLQVEFPSDYPKKLFNISLEDNEIYPEGFTRFMNEGIQGWIKERQQYRDENDLAFRPFLKWFDRNAESLVLDAGRKVKQLRDAQEAGITLIPHDQINPLENNTESPPVEPPYEEEGGEVESCENSTNHHETNSDDVNELLSHDGTDKTVTSGTVKLSSKVKYGTELKFSHLEINENVASMYLKNLLLVVQCIRCKGKTEFNLQSKKRMNMSCKKCHVNHSATFHPEIIHQYSHIVGYLHVEGCKAFDVVLLDSTVIVNCLNCSKDNTKKGIAYGKKGDHWCEFCHTKMEIQIMSTKFTHLQKNGEKLQEVKPVSKKSVKHPGIKEGSPLPDNGTCKHYKKSYRWLRFPCCGKVYPCDICHEEGEENDHEMKFATRMICGYCSKEQPFAKDKPCVSCKANVTKSRSTHWEGGKGCRNRTTMDRNENKKTAGLGKTISRKKAAEV